MPYDPSSTSAWGLLICRCWGSRALINPPVAAVWVDGGPFLCQPGAMIPGGTFPGAEVPQRVWCGVCSWATTWGPQHVVDEQMARHYETQHGIELEHPLTP